MAVVHLSLLDGGGVLYVLAGWATGSRSRHTAISAEPTRSCFLQAPVRQVPEQNTWSERVKYPGARRRPHVGQVGPAPFVWAAMRSRPRLYRRYRRAQADLHAVEQYRRRGADPEGSGSRHIAQARCVPAIPPVYAHRRSRATSCPGAVGAHRRRSGRPAAPVPPAGPWHHGAGPVSAARRSRACLLRSERCLDWGTAPSRQTPVRGKVGLLLGHRRPSLRRRQCGDQPGARRGDGRGQGHPAVLRPLGFARHRLMSHARVGTASAS